MPLATYILRLLGRHYVRGAYNGITGPGFISRGARLIIALMAALVFVLPARSSEDPRARKQAMERFQQAREKHKAQPANVEAAWQFARATYDLAEFATNKHERAELAQQGMDTCTGALVITNNAPLHYYLGMNLGQMARTKGLGGLKIVREMEHEFTLARGLDEHFDNAGPDRCLGLLYREAPTIGSIGSRSKARTHLRRAVVVAPNFPENRLDLVESEWNWGDRRDARAEFVTMEAAWERMHKAFSGPEWADDWTAWQSRREKIGHKLTESAKKGDSSLPDP